MGLISVRSVADTYNFLGTLCPLIGLLATILTLMMTTVFVYRKLAKPDIEVSGQD